MSIGLENITELFTRLRSRKNIVAFETRPNAFFFLDTLGQSTQIQRHRFIKRFSPFQKPEIAHEVQLFVDQFTPHVHAALAEYFRVRSDKLDERISLECGSGEFDAAEMFPTEIEQSTRHQKCVVCHIAGKPLLTGAEIAIQESVKHVELCHLKRKIRNIPRIGGRCNQPRRNETVDHLSGFRQRQAKPDGKIRSRFLIRQLDVFGLRITDGAAWKETLLREKLNVLHIGDELLHRAVNEGFSGGEKKRNEIFQMAVLEPMLAILDETDSGLDIDALKTVAEGVNRLRSPDRGMIVITHYQRLLDYIVPDKVHVLADGILAATGGADLALKLEEEGYAWLEDGGIGSITNENAARAEAP